MQAVISMRDSRSFPEDVEYVSQELLVDLTDPMSVAAAEERLRARFNLSHAPVLSNDPPPSLWDRVRASLRWSPERLRVLAPSS